MSQAIEFDWDDANRAHLAIHKITPVEFEEVFGNDPVDLDYEQVDDEERYRFVGVTNTGRLLTLVWTIRNGKVRAVTAFRASALARKAYFGRSI